MVIVVAVDSVTVIVNLTSPPTGSIYEQIINITVGQSGFDAGELPQDIDVWATLTDVDTGLPFTDYDYAGWVWSGDRLAMFLIYWKVAA